MDSSLHNHSIRLKVRGSRVNINHNFLARFLQVLSSAPKFLLYRNSIVSKDIIKEFQKCSPLPEDLPRYMQTRREIPKPKRYACKIKNAKKSQPFVQNPISHASSCLTGSCVSPANSLGGPSTTFAYFNAPSPLGLYGISCLCCSLPSASTGGLPAPPILFWRC